MLVYQEYGRYFGQLADGMEDFAEKELKELGASNIEPSYRGIFFDATQEELYRIVYETRFCTRIFAPLLSFDCHSTNYLYKTAQKIDWSSIFSLDHTFAINANVANSQIRHSRYATFTLKDAIVDQFRENTGERPSIDSKNPDVLLNLFINKDKAVINFDCAGSSLHKRGYRKASVEAPMMETVAAAIAATADWQGERPLVDPFCGSGTLICESLMRANNMPAGYFRKNFGFEMLPDFDETCWKKVRAESDAKVTKPDSTTILMSDLSHRSLDSAKENLTTFPADWSSGVEFKQCDFRDLPPLKDVTIITNPPYGIRLGDRDEVEILLKEFGDYLKQKCTGSTAYIYFGDYTLVKKLGLKPTYRIPLSSGGLDGRICRYDLY